MGLEGTGINEILGPDARFECIALETIFENPLFSICIGAGITWFASWYYYKRAGDQLKAEAKSLHAATSAMAYLLEHPDAITEIQRDGSGRISGVLVNISGSATMTFTGAATLAAHSASDK